MSVGLLMPAAGSGTRFGGCKQIVPLAGRALLLRALDPFVGRVAEVVIAVNESVKDAVEACLVQEGWDLRVRVVIGGSQRADSVARALAALDPACDRVLVHDAARPLLTATLVERCIAALDRHRAVLVADSCHATLKEISPGQPPTVLHTVDRQRFRLAQTPQGFHRLDGERAFAAAGASDCTDEAQVLERAGIVVAVVDGVPTNIKVTTPEDLALAEALWQLRG